MKFKDLKLGAKLAIGFGVLIAIAIFLGGMAVVNMSKITTESEYLAHEYVPEVKIATDLRGAANRTMYEMRGYGYTEEERFYNDAQKEIRALKQAIADGEALEKNAERLVKLSGQLQIAKEATNKYLQLVDKTVELNKLLEEQRGVMDESAALYMKGCVDYLDNQNKRMHREIVAGNTTTDRLKKVTLINDIIDQGNAIRVGNFKSQAQRDPKIFEDALANFPVVLDLLQEIRGFTKLDADLKELDQIEKAADNYHLAMDEFIEHWLEREKVAVLREEAGKEVIAACASTSEAGLNGTQEIADNSVNLLNRSNAVMVSGLLIALIIGVVFAIFLTRAITAPVNKGVQFARQLSDGDLTATIDVDQEDEIGQLAKALTNMGAKLREIVENVIAGADNIASASIQMSSTSQEMSQGATEQASSVEEVSSSMEEMAANIQNNTDNAQQTEKIAMESATGVKEGSEATNTAVESMKNIAEKISIINDIAFQTNILALNAAVEAARAGEHGKGFAVVAAEVRKLAERSKISADEIDSISKSGVAIAEKAGAKLQEIVPNIERTAQLVQEIASASIEQNSGADQINNAMQQLNNVTQQNAAASEEMATSSEELSSQAQQLKDLINYFNTGTSARGQSFKRNKKVNMIVKNNNKENNVKKEDLSLEQVSQASENPDADFENF